MPKLFFSSEQTARFQEPSLGILYGEGGEGVNSPIIMCKISDAAVKPCMCAVFLLLLLTHPSFTGKVGNLPPQNPWLAKLDKYMAESP